MLFSEEHQRKISASAISTAMFAQIGRAFRRELFQSLIMSHVLNYQKIFYIWGKVYQDVNFSYSPFVG